MRSKIDLDKYDNIKYSFINDYNNFLSNKTLATKYKLNVKLVARLIKYWELNRDKSKVQSKSLSNNNLKLNKYNEIKNNISKEDIYSWYIEEDNSYVDAPAHFKITQWMFDKLCRDYGIKKDRKKTKIKSIQTCTQIYGPDNVNNWRKAQETRIINSGSLEASYSQAFKKIKQTNLEKYGTSILFNLPSMQQGKKEFSGPNEYFSHLLTNNNIQFDREFVIDTKAYDFKVNNILIEINPTITHNSDWIPFGNHEGKDKKYHYNKSILAKNNSYRCIHVWDWDDKTKIINLLKDRPTIYARKCIIHNISYHEAEQYINKYHLQGYAKSKIKLGLFYNNELVSVMTFSKPRYNSNYEWELIRYCAHYNVIGGANKLFNYFINKYKPQSVISYCDNSKFNGVIYEQLNFKLISKGQPTAHWYSIKTKQHITDALLRKQGFSRLVNGLEAKEDNLETNNNETLMLNAGFLRVYDCGQSVYVYIKC